MSSVDTTVAEIRVPPVLNPQTLEQLGRALGSIDSGKRFLLLRGDARVFCTGLDIQWIAHAEIDDETGLKRFSDILSALHGGPFVSIAMVEGEVAGGGMGILAACDFVFAAGTSSYSLPEGLLGFIPGMILPYLLDKMSATSIKTMVYTGRKYSVETMASWGLVHEVADASRIESTVAEFIRSMKSCKPHAAAALKRMLSEADCQREALVRKGAASLLENLARTEVKERLATLAEYLSGC